MSENKSKLPHDKFVRKVFSKRKNLVDFLRNALPKKYYDKLDVNSVQLSKESFIGNKYVSKQLGEFYSDMLVEMKLDGKDAKCGILIEHKSAYNKFTLAQMHKYLSSLWNEEILNGAGNLTPIIPILLYHGQQDWDSSNNMEMCFDKNLDEDFQSFIPRFDYILFDLNTINDDELKGNIEYIVTMRILKHIFRDLLSELKRLLSILENYAVKSSITDELIDFLEGFIAYISQSEDIEPENIDDIVDTISNNELKEVIMTLEKKLELRGEKRGIEKGIEKGRKEGEERGREEGRKETAKNLKRIGLDIDKIVEATGLSKEEIEKL